jgi:hypothetical protein
LIFFCEKEERGRQPTPLLERRLSVLSLVAARVAPLSSTLALTWLISLVAALRSTWALTWLISLFRLVATLAFAASRAVTVILISLVRHGVSFQALSLSEEIVCLQRL